MKHINIEIKAKCFHPQKVEAFLVAHNANFKGTDLQKDTYFHVPHGRLKLRQGNIENNLIYYKRDDQKGPKQSNFYLIEVSMPLEMEAILAAALGIKIIVEKKRRIFYLGNIKVHIDEVPQLGCFIEIEAGNILRPDISAEELRKQCTDLMQHFEIRDEDLIEKSYSDMLLSHDC
jgi:adenylate cyclase class 2